jgi:homocysteine S-methyltransferase
MSSASGVTDQQQQGAMTTTPACRPPQFITDGGIETHIIFNMGVELPHFSTFPLNDSVAGREVIRSYYRDYLPVARAAGRSFLFATDSWRASPDWADRLGYDRALLKQNNATSAALCAELADEFAAAGVTSTIAGVY